MFLGDEHVLKSFGRENSEYATSVYKKLTAKVKNDEIDATEIDLLKKMAQRVTNEHTASISNNGKYISFRHAGGDYLNQTESILNVVGRFVRALVIASDPAAYRNDYLKKVALLVDQTSSPHPDNLASQYKLLTDIIKNGAPVYQVTALVPGNMSDYKIYKIYKTYLVDLMTPLIQSDQFESSWVGTTKGKIATKLQSAFPGIKFSARGTATSDIEELYIIPTNTSYAAQVLKNSQINRAVKVSDSFYYIVQSVRIPLSSSKVTTLRNDVKREMQELKDKLNQSSRKNK